QRLNNGELKQIRGFTKEGEVKLMNGWVIPKEYGHVMHGYCVTSYGSQSKSVDRVFVAESSQSFRAADREQFYVSASRFKEALTIYTDDKEELLEAVSKSSERASATDLLKEQLPVMGQCVSLKTRITPRSDSEAIEETAMNSQDQKEETSGVRSQRLARES